MGYSGKKGFIGSKRCIKTFVPIGLELIYKRTFSLICDEQREHFNVFPAYIEEYYCTHIVLFVSHLLTPAILVFCLFNSCSPHLFHYFQLFFPLSRCEIRGN